LITPEALSDLQELSQSHAARGTITGISAASALLVAELIEHVKTIGTDYKRVADYVAPPAVHGGPAPAAVATSGTGAAAAPPAPTPSRLVVDFGDKMTAAVTTPVEQLRTTVDSHAKAIEKGAAGLAELQTAKTSSDARIQALEAHFLQLDAAHRRLSDRITGMGLEMDESEAVTEALGEAVREARSPLIVVVEEGEETSRTTRARPMRQARTPVRKAQARKKK
jgi:hypothetical protein